MSGLTGKTVLLTITGSIAAYKTPDLVRRLRERGARVVPVLTAGGAEFVTPMALSAVSHEKVHDDLFDRDDQLDVGHIRLAREADLILVAPASAGFIGKMANGLADDLASAILLAADCPVFVAPAMNPAMWSHAAVQRNCATLRRDGIRFIGPDAGEMAERGEAGTGRMTEPLAIADRMEEFFRANQTLSGVKALVTAGPTHEPIDPVRYIANRSSGKQGYAIAGALADLGADVTLVSGPVQVPPPPGVKVVRVETAIEMEDAALKSLPADVAVMTAAVADWRVDRQPDEKIKKRPGEATPDLKLVENPDILYGLGHREKDRPALLIGFAAETTNVADHAKAKLIRKKADWIVANDVSPETGVMGGDRNRVLLVSHDGIDEWPDMEKTEVAKRLAEIIAAALNKKSDD